MDWDDTRAHPLPPMAECLRIWIMSGNGREWVALSGTRHKLFRSPRPYQMAGEPWMPRAANSPPEHLGLALVR